MEAKQKPCKGTGKAKDHGCGELSFKRVLGLCTDCYKEWLYSTDEGMERIKRHSLKAKTDRKKVERIKACKTKIEVYSKEYKKTLQREINKLSRMIDQQFNYKYCIDCGNIYGNQTDAGHFHSVGSHPSLRYNLHNIHSQASHCNRNGLGGGKQFGYYKGLIKRYGDDYAELIDKTLPKLYPTLKLTPQEVFEALNTVRQIIRKFDKYDFTNAVQAREELNNEIGIYK